MAATFKGLIKAVNAFQEVLKAHHVKIWVRYRPNALKSDCNLEFHPDGRMLCLLLFKTAHRFEEQVQTTRKDSML